MARERKKLMRKKNKALRHHEVNAKNKLAIDKYVDETMTTYEYDIGPSLYG